jgi:uncharacterized membrane protein (DUF106 family)
LLSHAARSIDWVLCIAVSVFIVTIILLAIAASVLHWKRMSAIQKGSREIVTQKVLTETRKRNTLSPRSGDNANGK